MPKVQPKAQTRVSYSAVLESRLEIGLEDLNFISNWRIRFSLYFASKGYYMGQLRDIAECSSQGLPKNVLLGRFEFEARTMDG